MMGRLGEAGRHDHDHDDDDDDDDDVEDIGRYWKILEGRETLYL